MRIVFLKFITIILTSCGDKYRENKANVVVNHISRELDFYFEKNARYPESEVELKSLFSEFEHTEEEREMVLLFIEEHVTKYESVGDSYVLEYFINNNMRSITSNRGDEVNIDSKP